MCCKGPIILNDNNEEKSAKNTGHDVENCSFSFCVTWETWESHLTLLCPWNSPGKNTGVGCHFLLQRIFLTQGSNPSLWHCRQILYHLSHQGSPI